MGELFKNIIDKKSKAYSELRFFLLFNRIKTEEDLIKYIEHIPLEMTQMNLLLNFSSIIRFTKPI